MVIGIDAGLGAASARVGVAKIRAHDAGYDGWSFELRYLRPWLIQWGLNEGTDYLGAGVTRYFSWFRFSGALVTGYRKTRAESRLWSMRGINIRVVTNLIVKAFT